ncbi:hypothetical protein LTR08_003605 [Meristemomyces frigidus]|nr:hypothetical protein LTR08_003605 [Meristemomyces frigidus]
MGFITALCVVTLSALINAQTISLGSAGDYGVFAASAITNTGTTVVHARIGMYPGTALTGFPPGIDNGEDIGNAAASAVKDDIQSVYDALFALPATNMTGDLGGQTLPPGVYSFSSSGGLTGALTLDAQNDPDAQFVFKFGTTLTTAEASSIILVNSAMSCNIFWQVGSSATLGSTSVFSGSVIALDSITVTTGVTLIQGGFYALTGAVTLDTNDIDGVGTCAAPVTPSGGLSSSLAAIYLSARDIYISARDVYPRANLHSARYPGAYFLSTKYLSINDLTTKPNYHHEHHRGDYE